MGREIRKVPADWQHPKKDDGRYIPMYEDNYEDAIAEWIADHNLWLAGKHPNQKPDYKYFAEYNGNPPSFEDHVTYKKSECTHFQMYETVSEGTPVTPVFASLQELEDYLVDVGESAGTKYNRKHSRSAAHAFCQSGYAPSMVIIPGKGIFTGVESADQH